MKVQLIKYATIALLIQVTLSCQPRDRKAIAKKEPESKAFILQPFDGFPDTLAQHIYDRLREINPNTYLKDPIPLPKMAYYKDRNRYRADSLINFLWRQSSERKKIIGLTNKDISSTKGKIKDWGVMGLAYSPGYSCVVSTFRLSKKNMQSQLYKLTLHELAHTEGLPHCRRDSTCYMSDANGTNPWDAEHDFCTRCKNFLKRKRWNLN